MGPRKAISQTLDSMLLDKNRNTVFYLSNEIKVPKTRIKTLCEKNDLT